MKRLRGAVDPAEPREETGADGERATFARLEVRRGEGRHETVDDGDVLRTVLEIGFDCDTDLHQHSQRGGGHSEKIVGYHVVAEQERLVDLIAEVEYHVVVFVILLEIRSNDFSGIVMHRAVGVLRPAGKSHSYT